MEIKLVTNGKQRKRSKFLRIEARRQLPWLILDQKEQCFFCESRIELGRNASTEHIHPLCDGGDNRPGNIVAACLICNAKRNTEYHAKLREEAKYALAESLIKFIQRKTL